MFSVAQKRKIAAAIEEVLLSIKHPEMPDEKPSFHLHVRGLEDWSWADIHPNWNYDEQNPPSVNLHNEAVAKLQGQE